MSDVADSRSPALGAASRAGAVGGSPASHAAGTDASAAFAWSIRSFSPSRRLWLASAVLAGLRTASNDPLRAAIRHRGTAKNRLNDVQGCFGELAALRIAEWTAPAGTRAVVSPMDWDGPTDDVDLVLVDAHGGERRFETKTHLHAPQKKLFLINDVAHQRSVARGAESYLPIVSQLGSPVAVAGAPVTIEQVGSWPVRTFSSRPENDPARSCALRDLAPGWFGRAWGELQASVGDPPPIADPDREIWPAFEQGHAAYAVLRRERPDWSTVGYEALLDALVAVPGG